MWLICWLFGHSLLKTRIYWHCLRCGKFYRVDIGRG
jgi:hypothetical protein